MKNIKEWKEMIKEVMNKEIDYDDQVSIFVKHNSGYVVIENEGRQGLQLQYRSSLDHSDIVVNENVVVHGKMISALSPGNYEDVKKIFAEFVGKI